MVDETTQRGVPLVAVATPNGNGLTDSQGVVAYCDANHMGSTSLRLTSHGFEPLCRLTGG